MGRLVILGLLLAMGAWWVTTGRAPEEEPLQRSPLPEAAELRRLPPDGGAEFNRLVHETSPYLLQHARNPVDWYPWGPEALARAQREDKPIFLSVGYSSCHWCHVMEHESFEHDDVAKLLNRFFVPVKVDREERPDLDDLYMAATQLMTGRGGWPNSVWLMPDGRPWFAGTYFPREDRMGQAGFLTILKRLAEVWATRRPEVEEQARQLTEAIRQHAAAATLPAQAQRWRDLVERALMQLTQQYDMQHGGFGQAPKFPPHSALALLLHEQRLRPTAPLRTVLTGTLDGMLRGGLRDHVGGGFHRYATDERWLVPHFEKMLYDNAQLARAFAEAWALTDRAPYRAVAREICDWVLREMTSPEGGFFSALDADSEGVEGKFYTWSRAEILERLGREDGERFCRVYQVEAAGNYHDEASRQPTGLNIPHLQQEPDHETAAQLVAPREILREARAQRVWPALDDKVLVSWNGLMIGALAATGRRLREPRYVAAAERAARFILREVRPNGRLLHTWRKGTAKVPGFLDDHAALALGLVDLFDATGDRAWLEEARGIADALLEHFEDRANGGFFSTSGAHEDLLVRNKDAFDQAMPSGNGLAALALLRLAEHVEQERYEAAVLRALEGSAAVLERVPTGTCSLQLALAQLLDRRPLLEHAAPHVLKAGAEPSTVSVRPGAPVSVTVRIAMREGWHIQAHSPLERHLVATVITLDANAVATLREVDYPDPAITNVASIGDRVAVYQGSIAAPVTLQVMDGAPAGRHTLHLRLRAQPCDERSCQAPVELTIPVELDVEQAPARPR